MHLSRSAVFRLGLGAALAACLALAPACASDAAPPPPLRYVNMGDSYSAGAGVQPAAPGAPADCARSAANWGHDLATARGYQLTDVSCSGARTTDYRTAQYADVPPQLNALSASTQLVTMTIGGNDDDVFADTIRKCAAAAVTTTGRGDPCQRTYGGAFTTRITTITYPGLVRALTDVRRAAPRARILISGYPRILPPITGCYPSMPVADGDVPYLDGIEAALNDAVQRAASATGVTFVDQVQGSTGHDACQPVGTRWVEPVIGAATAAPAHPNALGEKAMADAAAARIAP